MNIEPVTSSRDLKALRKLHNLVESHVRSLKALGVEADTYGSLLSSVILSKLPSDLQLIISRCSSESHQNLIPLLKAIEEEIEAGERVQPKPNSSQQRRAPEQQLPTATTLVSNTVPSGVSCCYCQQHHPSGTCTRVTQVDTRKQILKRSGCCFCYLKRVTLDGIVVLQSGVLFVMVATTEASVLRASHSTGNLLLVLRTQLIIPQVQLTLTSLNQDRVIRQLLLLLRLYHPRQLHSFYLPTSQSFYRQHKLKYQPQG